MYSNSDSAENIMARCIMVFRRDSRYHRIPESEVEDWEEVLDAIDGEPELIERLSGWEPYTHAYRLPDASVYLVALESE
jgi:hypothetical protein